MALGTALSPEAQVLQHDYEYNKTSEKKRPDHEMKRRGKADFSLPPQWDEEPLAQTYKFAYLLGKKRDMQHSYTSI